MRSVILMSMEQDSRTEKYQQMRQLLNEKQWRQFLALEAKERGNIVLVAREAGVSKNTIKAGRREIETGERFAPGKRIRGAGGGRKKQEEHDASLQAGLQEEGTDRQLQEQRAGVASQRRREHGQRLRLPVASRWESRPVWRV